MGLKKNKIFQNCNKPTIILMTKWHALNRCKSRLSKEIGPFNATKIQAKLTKHTISVVKEIEKEGLAEIKIAFDGIGFKAARRWASSNKIENVSLQGNGNLGLRMKKQILKTYSKKSFSSYKSLSPILLIGTDLPGISYEDLAEAIEYLQRKELVLGPSTDGGYWLIGFSKKLLNTECAWPFSGINWGTDQVLKETLRLADLNRINYQLLQEKNDIDTLVDLSRWIYQTKFKLSASLYQL